MNQELETVQIKKAITDAYSTANISINSFRGITPLFELIKAYPLRVVELDNLSYNTVREYLHSETGCPPNMPATHNKNLAGFLYAAQYLNTLEGFIFLRKNDLLGRRRFSAAHEFGHYLLHFLPLLEKKSSPEDNLVLTEGLVQLDEESETTNGEPSFSTMSGQILSAPVKSIAQIEDEADRFAAELTMPADLCRQLTQDIVMQLGTKLEVIAKRLAAELLVSQAAIQWRLRELNLPESLIIAPKSLKVRQN